MKRIISWISLLGMLLLVSCSLVVQPSSTPPAGGDGVATTATLSDVEMQTRIAQLLTSMPTGTPQPEQSTPTEALPTLTLAPDNVQPTSTEQAPTPAPTDTAQPAADVSAPTATATVPPTPAPTATATLPPVPAFTAPAGDPRSKLGAPASTDPMDNERAWVWPTGTDKYSSASFSNGSMALTALTDVDGWRMANPRGSDYTNLYLEGTFNSATCKGTDHYGLIVRVPVLKEANKGYLFGITCNGSYSLRRWDGTIGQDGKMEWLVRWTPSPAIATGSDKVNRLGLMAVGNRLILYVNGTLLTEVKDSTFSAGYFGAFVGADDTNNYTVRIDEMAYWENPQP